MAYQYVSLRANLRRGLSGTTDTIQMRYKKARKLIKIRKNRYFDQ